MRRLYRSKRERMIAGVCGGMAEYFDVDPTAVRIAWVLLALVTAFVPVTLIYIICWAIIPLSPMAV